MKLTIDTTGKQFRVTRTPQAKTDSTGEQRTDKETGLPQWTTQIAAVDEEGGDIVAITTSGPIPAVDLHDQVEVTGLVAIPWNTNGRNGIAYRAREIKPILGDEATER